MSSIQEIVFTTNECEQGVVLDYSMISGLPPKDEYILKFTTESTFPLKPPYSVDLQPSSYDLIGSLDNYSPTVVAKVNSVHQGETKTLIKLTITDKYNQTLSTRYLKLICKPSDIYVGVGSFNAVNNVGPNGGSVITLEDASLLNVGTSVFAPPFIPQGTTIVGIYAGNRIEVLPKLTFSGGGFDGGVTNGSFFDIQITFNINVGCGTAESLLRREREDNFIYLTKDNNWAYKYQDKTLIKFVRAIDDDSIVIRIPAQNKSLFPGFMKPAQIPYTCQTYVGGRVYRLGPCSDDLP